MAKPSAGASKKAKRPMGKSGKVNLKTKSAAAKRKSTKEAGDTLAARAARLI